MTRGNCYVASEALFYILGGRAAGWHVYRMRTADDTHWFLKHENGIVLDPSRLQFGGLLPDYSKATRTGFLTGTPSKRARLLMEKLTWQDTSSSAQISVARSGSTATKSKRQ